MQNAFRKGVHPLLNNDASANRNVQIEVLTDYSHCRVSVRRQNHYKLVSNTSSIRD